MLLGKSKETDIIVFSSSSPSDQSLVSTAGIFPATPPPRGRRRPRCDKEVKRTEVEDQNLVSTACISPATPPRRGQRRQRNDKEVKRTEVVDFNRRRVISSDMPTRSPTLSAEIRRSSSVKSPETIGKSPALVARLMGLEAVPAIPAKETSSEKRRKLLGALEKCDNDLKALKEVIMAFRSPESDSPAKEMAVKCLNQDKVRTISGRKCTDYCNCGDGEKQQNESNRLLLNRISRTARGRENGTLLLLAFNFAPKC